MADFLASAHFDFSQPERAIRQLLQQARQAQSAMPAGTDGRNALLDVEARFQRGFQGAAARGEINQQQLFQAVTQLREVMRQLARELTSSGRATSQRDLDRRLIRQGGVPLDLEALRQRAEAEARSSATATPDQAARLAALRAAQASVKSDPALKADLARLTAAYRAVPKAVRDALGLDISELKATAAAVAGMRAGGGAASPAATLVGANAANRMEMARYLDVARERAYAVRDGRGTTGPIAPGPVSNLRGEAEALRRRRNAAEQLALERQLASDTGLTQATAEAAALKRRRTASEQLALERILAGDSDLARTTRDLASARRERLLRERTAADRAAVSQAPLAAAAQIAADQRRAAEQLERYRQVQLPIVPGSRTTVADQLAAGTAADRSRAALINASVQRQLETDKTYIESTAQAAAARRRLQSAINAREREILKETGFGGGSGTLFQRIQAYMASRREGGVPRPANEFQTGGQFLSTRFLTTAGYAASGALLYGGINFIQEMVREASELQLELGLVRAQFEAAGISAERFGEHSNTLINISRETGVAADELARLDRSLTGIFRNVDTQTGEDNGPDVGRVERELEVAARFATVTKTPATQIQNDMSAIFTAFRSVEPNIGFANIADDITAVSDRTGVAAGELLSFTSQLAPLATELGFTSRELAAFGAVMSQASGRPAATLAENLGRVLTRLSEPGGQTQTDLLNAYLQNPQLRGNFEEQAKALRTGDVSTALRQLLEDYQKLDKQGRSALVNVFGAREAQSFIALLNNAEQGLQVLDDTSERDGAAFEKRWEEHKQTVTFAFAQMQRAVEEFGIQLFEAGLGDALKVLVATGGVLLEVLKGILTVFEGLNDVTGGAVGKLIGVAVAIRAITAALRVLRGVALVNAVTGAASAAAAAATGGVAAGTTAGALSRAGYAGPGSVGGVAAGGVGGAAAGRFAAARAGATAGAGALGRGALAAVGGPVGLGVLAASVVALYGVQWINNAKKQAEAEAREYAQALQSLSEDELARLKSGEAVQGLPDAPGGGIGNTRGDLIADEEARRAADNIVGQLRAARDAFQFPDREDIRARLAEQAVTEINRALDADINAISAAASAGLPAAPPQALSGNKAYSDAITKYQTSAEGSPEREEARAAAYAELEKSFVDRRARYISTESEINDLIDEYLKDPANAEAYARAQEALNSLTGIDAAAAAAASDFLRQTQQVESATKRIEKSEGKVELFIAEYQKGIRQSSTVFEAFRQQIRDRITLAEAARQSGDEVGYRKLMTEAYQLQASSREFSDSVYQQRRDLQAAIAELTGADTSGTTRQINIDAIRDPANSFQGDLAAARALTEEAKAAWEEQIENADSFAEVQRLLNEGWQIPPEVFQVVARAALEDPRVGDALQEFLADRYNSEDQTANLDKFAEEIAAMDEAARQLMIEAVRKRIERLRKISRAFAAMNDLDVDEAIAEAEGIITALETVTTALETTGNGDAEENADRFAEAQRRFFEQQKSLITARAALAKSWLDADDTVGRAEIDVGAAADLLDLARQAMAAASGDDRASAEAEVIQAQASYNEAVSALAQAQKAKAQELNQALRDLASAQASATGDPIVIAQQAVANANQALAEAETEVDRIRAQIEIINATAQLADAYRAIDAALADLALARVEGNALATAQQQVANAQRALNAARGDAERISAQADLIRAQRALDEAIFDIAVSRSELALAYANSTGDAIGAAQAQLQIAMQRLARLRDSGAGEAELNRAQAEVVAAQAAVRDARYNEQIRDIDFALQMERITAQEAIRQLEALLRIPNLTKEQTQQLLLKIKQLRDELGRDLQFNLPEFLTPTLAEVKGTFPGGGGGAPNIGPAPAIYDQRSITVQIDGAKVNNDRELADMIVADIADQIGGPPRDSQTGRIGW